MVMRHLENELRRTGDEHDAERADHVAAMLKARGEDVPFSLYGTINLQGETLNFAISTAPLEEVRDLTASDFLRNRLKRSEVSVDDLETATGISRSTLYRALQLNKFGSLFRLKLPQIAKKLNLSPQEVEILTSLLDKESD